MCFSDRPQIGAADIYIYICSVPERIFGSWITWTNFFSRKRFFWLPRIFGLEISKWRMALALRMHACVLHRALQMHTCVQARWVELPFSPRWPPRCAPLRSDRRTGCCPPQTLVASPALDRGERWKLQRTHGLCNGMAKSLRDGRRMKLQRGGDRSGLTGERSCTRTETRTFPSRERKQVAREQVQHTPVYMHQIDSRLPRVRVSHMYVAVRVQVPGRRSFWWRVVLGVSALYMYAFSLSHPPRWVFVSTIWNAKAIAYPGFKLARLRCAISCKLTL